MLNAGAVTFHGVVDEYLFRACAALGPPAAARWRTRAASRYQRVGATWWRHRLDEAGTGPGTGPGVRPTPEAVVHLRRAAGPAGSSASTARRSRCPTLKGLRYLLYLARRPGADVPAAELAAAGAGHAGRRR